MRSKEGAHRGGDLALCCTKVKKWRQEIGSYGGAALSRREGRFSRKKGRRRAWNNVQRNTSIRRGQLLKPSTFYVKHTDKHKLHHTNEIVTQHKRSPSHRTFGNLERSTQKSPLVYGYARACSYRPPPAKAPEARQKRKGKPCDLKPKVKQERYLGSNKPAVLTGSCDLKPTGWGGERPLTPEPAVLRTTKGLRSPTAESPSGR